MLHTAHSSCLVSCNNVTSILFCAGPSRVPSLTGLTGQAPSHLAAMPAPSASASFSFAALPNPSAATQQQQQPAPAAAPPATAAVSSDLAPSASTPTGATPVVGGAKLQLSAPSTTAGTSFTVLHRNMLYALGSCASKLALCCFSMP